MFSSGVVLGCLHAGPHPSPAYNEHRDSAVIFCERRTRLTNVTKKKLPATPYSEQASRRRLSGEKWPTLGPLKQLVAVLRIERGSRRQKVRYTKKKQLGFAKFKPFFFAGAGFGCGSGFNRGALKVRVLLP